MASRTGPGRHSAHGPPLPVRLLGDAVAAACLFVCRHGALLTLVVFIAVLLAVMARGGWFSHNSDLEFSHSPAVLVEGRGTI